MPVTASIIRIDSPSEVRLNEYVALRAIVTSDMSAVARRRLKWTIKNGTNATPRTAEGESVRYFVTGGPTGPLTITVSTQGSTVSKQVPLVQVLPHPGPLPSVVAFDPIPEKIAPRTVLRGEISYAAAVGAVPLQRIGTIAQLQPTASEPLRTGIFAVQATLDASYFAADYAAEFGFWTEILEPTAIEEGRRSFVALNTYDRATFTFGFTQFGAHTYGGNFHLLFRRILERHADIASQYFPEFRLQQLGGRPEIFGRGSGTWQPLTMPSDKSNSRFREYLKPRPDWITREEISFAARMLVATRRHRELQRLQVELAKESAVAIFDDLHNKGVPIDKQPDYICAWVFDIRNQGRGTNAKIKEALTSADPLAALREIGAPAYATRRKNLDSLITTRVNQGIFGRKKFNAATGDFDDL